MCFHGLILGSSLSSKRDWCRTQLKDQVKASPALHIFMTHVFLNIYPFCMCILLLYIFTKLLLLHVHALVYVHHCCLHLHAHSSLCPLREVGATLHLLTCISLSSKRGGATNVVQQKLARHSCLLHFYSTFSVFGNSLAHHYILRIHMLMTHVFLLHLAYIPPAHAHVLVYIPYILIDHSCSLHWTSPLDLRGLSNKMMQQNLAIC